MVEWRLWSCTVTGKDLPKEHEKYAKVKKAPSSFFLILNDARFISMTGKALQPLHVSLCIT